MNFGFNGTSGSIQAGDGAPDRVASIAVGGVTTA